jgi:arsenite methyltransferase
MSGLKFTEDAARQLERACLTRDVVAQRSETIKQLALFRGECVLDVGCGPGFLCEKAWLKLLAAMALLLASMFRAT